jgi:hypothetical protein
VSGQYLDVKYPLPPPPRTPGGAAHDVGRDGLQAASSAPTSWPGTWARGGREGMAVGGGVMGLGGGESEILKTELKSGKKQKTLKSSEFRVFQYNRMKGNKLNVVVILTQQWLLYHLIYVKI